VNRIVGADGRPSRLRALATSDFSRCGLTMDGDVLCDRGVTGGFVDSAGKPEAVPRACENDVCVLPLPIRGSLPRAHLRDIAAGMFHACALAPNGTAHCWGRNRMGDLGNGMWAADSTGSTGEVSRAPTAVVGGKRFSQISAAEELTCGVTVPERDVYCWGYGQNGETGDSTIMTGCDGPKPYYTKPCSTPVPARVLPESLPGDYGRPDDVKFARVAAGMRMACAISVQGDGYCWGSNYRCELGRCRSAESARAHRIPVPGRVVEVAAGYWHACARTSERRVFCWGHNDAGQLGSLATANAGPDGQPPDYRDSTNQAVTSAAYGDPCFNGGRCSPTPVEVSPGRRWAALALGTDHACALAEDDGGIYCWGGTERMALGTGARLVRCENRSAMWNDTQCQPTPVRVPGLPRLAAPRATVELTALAGLGSLTPLDSVARATRVQVSAREVRVTFAPDTAGTWGWPEAVEPQRALWYHWSVLIDGLDGPRSLELRVGQGERGARTYPTLAALVASAKPGLCAGGMIAACDSSGVAASVEGNRVVLTLRDARAITRLFGLRQPTVQASLGRPQGPAQRGPVSVPVEYVRPQLPLPDSASRAEAAAARRRYEASIHSITRSISAGTLDADEIWIGVGDSVQVRVAEMRCTQDACGGGGAFTPDSAAWAVDDSALVRLRFVQDPGAARKVYSSEYPKMYLVARATGRTKLRMSLPPLPTDTMPFREPPPRTLERGVVVTAPAVRVVIAPRPDTIRVGQSLELLVQVFDAAGKVLAGAPVRVRYDEAGSSYVKAVAGTFTVAFRSPGAHTIVASFGKLADTVRVAVIGETKR
jgi:hypothetical protein